MTKAPRLAILVVVTLLLSVDMKVRAYESPEEEALRHFLAILRLDTQNPPGNELLVVDYLKGVLRDAGIDAQVFAREPQRPNLVARLRGSGARRPLLLMGHTDVVTVDAAKWKHPPFSATREGGYIYARGTQDDKPSVVAGLMTLLQLKRSGVALDRDVIFLAEASEEGNGPFGINHMVAQHWPEIDAEYCLAEGGGVVRTGGRVQFAAVATTEKIAHTIRLVSRGPAGHGSVPLQSNAIVHLAQAVGKVAAWRTPMRLNDTTRAYFSGLAAISSPEASARYRAIVEGGDLEGVQAHLAAHEPALDSRLRTSISPNIIKGGYLRNVIPSEAEATLDIRALPDEDFSAFLARLREVIGDPAVEITRVQSYPTRPGAPPSRLDTEAYKAIDAAHRRVYGVPTLPSMLAGGTDMAQVRAKGVQCYGIGPIADTEDPALGFGPHSDQERILEDGFRKFIQVHFEIVRDLAVRR
jgi:acetylornithine deacetylase/succinyl-diaminopimelate desuccinylase-like protein